MPKFVVRKHKNRFYLFVMTIEQHIEYLLRGHDCVILPGWGAFIALRQCARMDGGMLMPPSRSYGFNGALTFSDGLLENSIVRRTRCSYATAGEQVREAVCELRRQIDANGEVAVGRVGVFTRNADGALVFSPFEKQIVASEYYGFAPLDFPTLQQRAAEKIAEEEPREDAIVVEIPAWQRVGKKYMQIAASIIVLLVMTFVLSTPLAVNHQGNDFAGLDDSFRIRSSEKAQAIADTGAARELAVMLPVGALDESKPCADGTEADASQQEEAAQGRFCLVVASGRSMQEAERYGEYHKDAGVKFGIIEVNGKYRVYAAASDSFEELVKVQEQLRTQFPDSWICTR